MDRINIIATAVVPDGYFGAKKRVNIALLPEGSYYRICCTAPAVFYTAPVPTCVDAAEAVWLIQNHPTMRRYFSDVQFV